ncbi:MAG TPA: PQQ-binding-like beta-propeller repeat protein [Bacteroides clarus]|uniref:outer membrane protein assembly factor BamB family protein n=1 Tax=Bacteroides clarus TaxID=626929 RepID=UPI001D93862F|nr:PQQ-binding-like beta-propeller repeat protein [Bacteroides clarus]HJF97710.1 PQQ-binding-like beta-propeller repeat protein [Bacteroides clarus]
MKKVIYSLFFVFAAVFTACEEELPKANFDLYELKSLEASAGDMNVTLTWEDYENAHPSEYLVIWTTGAAEDDGGQMTVEADKKSVVVENLVNDMTYGFSVQPRYAGGLAGKTSVNCTPKNARYPVTDLTATAGNERVRLNWTKPNSERFTNYQITVIPSGKVITLDDTSLESYIIEGLTNDMEYTFSMVASYPTGNSEPVEVSATPGKVSPILVDQSEKTELTLWEPVTFTLNDMFFMGGDVQSVNWDFGDGTASVELSPKHAYGAVGDKYTVSVTVTYTDGTTDTGSMDITVVNYKWDSINLESGNYKGYVKVSNPVFSLDGKTMYIPTSTPAGHLFAIDVTTGNIKWVYGIDAITYGGGALIGDDGTIYQCVESKDIDNVHAINSDGTKKWSIKLDDKIGAFPALSADGTVLYCLTNAPTLYALNIVDGSIKWRVEKLDDSNKGCAVAVDKMGNIYAGTNAAIYSFTSSGNERWNGKNIAFKITERGAFALHGDCLYATTLDKGLISVNMTTGEKNWDYKNTGGNAYFPIVDKNGVIYFTEKGVSGKALVYAVEPTGSLKWSKDIASVLTYNGAALSAEGLLFLGNSGGKKVWKLDTNDNGELTEVRNIGQNIMAGVTIGTDKRLYFGTIGSNNIGSIKAVAINASPELSSWSMRGGDLQGTNRQK